MISQEVIEAVTKFGGDIIHPQDGVIILEPDFETTPEQFVALFDLIKGNKDSPLEVGLINLLPYLLVSNWAKLNDEQKSEIRKKLFEKCSLALHEKAISRFADACIAVYKFSGIVWDELIKLIFEGEVVELTGYLFVRLMSSVEGTFIYNNMSKIIGLLTVLLPKSSCSVQTGLIVILSIIDSAKAFKENNQLIHLLWEALIHIFTQESDRIEFLLPLVADIFEASSEILNEKCEIISSTISSIDSIKSAEPILYLIPYLTLDDLTLLLEKLYHLAEAFISENNELPKDLISSIDEAPLDVVTKPAIEKIVEFLKPKLSTPAGLALFAPFSAHIGEQFGEEDLFAVVDNCLTRSPIDIALGLAIFECLSGYSQDLSFELPDALIYKFLDLFSRPEEFVRFAAYSTISSLIENNVFIHADQTAAFLKVYPKIIDTDIVLFFKQLRKLLRVEGISDEAIIALFEFSMDLFKSAKDGFIHAQSLSIICAIASQEECDDLVVNEIKNLLPIAVDLLKSDKIETYVYASRALVLFASLNPAICRRSVLALLPRIIQISTGEFKTNPKIQGNIAVALASILICLEVSKDFEKCISIVDNFVSSEEVHLITAAATMAEILRSTRDLKLNCDIFDSLSKTAAKTKDHETLSSLLNAIRKIIKSFDVPQKQVLPLLKLFLSGAHPVFERRPPSMFTDRNTKLYSYLTEVCDRYSDLAPEISNVTIMWFADAPLFMYGVLLELVTYIVGNKIVKDDDAKILIKIFINRMSGQKAGIDEVILGNILMLLKQNHNLCDKQNMIDQLIIYWGETKEDEISGWRAQVGSAILVLCSLGADAGKEIVEDILSDYPFEADFGKCEEMSEAIVKMFDLPEKKWEGLDAAFAKSITDILLLPKEKLDEHNLSVEVVKEMKRVLKAIIRANSIIEREISKAFGKNRPLQNRFKALLK